MRLVVDLELVQRAFWTTWSWTHLTEFTTVWLTRMCIVRHFIILDLALSAFLFVPLVDRFIWMCIFPVCCSSVEISPTLAKIQRETIGQVSSHLSKFRVENRDAADRGGWGMWSLLLVWFCSLSTTYHVLNVLAIMTYEDNYNYNENSLFL